MAEMPGKLMLFPSKRCVRNFYSIERPCPIPPLPLAEGCFSKFTFPVPQVPRQEAGIYKGTCFMQPRDNYLANMIQHLEEYITHKSTQNVLLLLSTHEAAKSTFSLVSLASSYFVSLSLQSP